MGERIEIVKSNKVTTHTPSRLSWASGLKLPIGKFNTIFNGVSPFMGERIEIEADKKLLVVTQSRLSWASGLKY